MKKKSCILLISLALAANTVNVYAYQPKIIGSVLSTDIIAYIEKTRSVLTIIQILLTF